MARAQAEAWRVAQGLCNRAKATVLGDLPSAWLPHVAFMREVRPGVDALGGLFAKVAFPQSTDPEQYALAVAEVGMTAALDFMSAAPIVGGLMKWILGLGGLLGRLFASSEPDEVKMLMLPWEAYSKAADQDFVQKFLVERFFSGVDWTDIFMPPYEAVPWTAGRGVNKAGKDVGLIWAPIKGGQVAHSVWGIGAMPGTFKMAGIVQSPDLPPADPRLLRYFSDGTMMHWGRALTDTGEFYPATAQTSMLAWQQAQRDGSPDMYKVDCGAVESAWVLYWDQFFDSLFYGFKKDEWIGEFAAPYLAVEAGTLRLGLRDPSRPSSPQLQRPHPAPLITPTIFTAGAGTPATRNPCLYLEHADGPYGRGGKANKMGAVSGGSLANVYQRKDGRAVASGGPASPGDVAPPNGSVCVPWPSGEELLVKYRRPDDAFILPAVRRLRERQKWCLKHTLVSAYVRCDGPDAYAAFAADPELRQMCRDMRAKLLQNPARFKVILADVHDIDPAFEVQLRKAGVTNTLAQMAGTFGLKNEADDDAKDDPAPPAIGPSGGVPFEGDLPPRVPRNSPKGGAAIGLAALGLGYLGYRHFAR